jgi:hypothetical protein
MVVTRFADVRAGACPYMMVACAHIRQQQVSSDWPHLKFRFFLPVNVIENWYIQQLWLPI